MKIPTPIRSEHVEQREFVSWFKKTFDPIEISSFPNGDDRSPSAALRMKLEGVNPGMPDLFVMEWNLYIEMKKIGGHLSVVQVKKHHYLRSMCNATVFVCYGFEDAKEHVLRFVRLMGDADKQHLLSERKELQRFLQEIPDDHVIDRMSIQARLDSVNKALVRE